MGARPRFRRAFQRHRWMIVVRHRRGIVVMPMGGGDGKLVDPRGMVMRIFLVRMVMLGLMVLSLVMLGLVVLDLVMLGLVVLGNVQTDHHGSGTGGGPESKQDEGDRAAQVGMTHLL